MTAFGFRYGWGSRRRRDLPSADLTVLTTEADEEIQTEAAEPVLIEP